jgi:hypothetical protein
MAHELTREDLKRNELGEAVEAGVHFAEHHLRLLLGVLGAVGAVALLGWGVWTWRSSRAEAASAALGEALRVAGAEIGAPEAADAPSAQDRPRFATIEARDARARELFEALVADYGSTGAASAARLWLGERALAAGDAAAAREHWRAVLAADDEGAYAATARLDLIRLDRASGRGEELVAELQREIAQGGSALPVDALLAELARTQEAAGRSADADATRRRLLDEHPSSPYAQEARRIAGAAESPGR